MNARALPRHSELARRCRFASAAFAAWLAGAEAFGLDPSLAVTQYRNQLWRAEDGLPQNSVYAILQTRDGYLWLGTSAGLARFDGVRFTVFDKANTPELRSDLVFALYEDREAGLWIGTADGLVRRRDETFTLYTTREGLPGGTVRVIAEDVSGRLWAGTDAGLGLLDGKAFRAFGVQDGLTSPFVRALLPEPDGSILVGTDRGIHSVRDGRISLDVIGGVPSHLRTAFIRAIHRDRKGVLWIGTRGSGLLRIGPEGSTVYSAAEGLRSDVVRTIHEDRDGALWVGTDGGLSRLQAGSLASYSARDGLAGDLVRVVYEDREGSLWVGTRQGLNRFYDGAFTSVSRAEGLLSDGVTSVLEDREGRLWLGNRNGGLNRLVEGRVVDTLGPAQGLPSGGVWALHEDPSGAVWIGTSNGLARWARGKVSQFGRAQGLHCEFVRAIETGPDGALWIGTQAGGLYRFRGGRFERIETPAELAADAVASLLKGRDGSLWIGSDYRGLFRFRDGAFTQLTARSGLSSDHVLSLSEDPDGTLWVGTYGGGLSRLRHGRFTRYTTHEGLPDNVICRILADGAGRLWASSNRGVYSVTRAQLNAVADGTASSVHVELFGHSDGMKSTECSVGGQPAGWRARDGRLWFATFGGVAAVGAGRLPRNELPPPVIVEEVVAGGRTLAAGNGLELPPGVRDLEFRYTGLSFLVPGRVRFRYMLEGFDRGWVEAGPRRVAHYGRLPPGTYRFRVTASNNDGVWNESGAQVAFRLRPHFFETAWFVALAAIGVGGAALVFHRRRVRGVRAEYSAVLSERSRIAREIHDTLAAGLTAVSLRLEGLTYVWGGAPAGARTVLDEARDTLRGCQAEVQRFVADLRPRELEAGDLSGALASVAQSLSRDSGIEMKVWSSGQPRPLPAHVESNLLRIAQEALTNVVRHARARRAWVGLRFEPAGVRLQISDDGRGFERSEVDESGTFGLVGMRERAREMRADLGLRSRPGFGTELSVSVPLGEARPRSGILAAAARLLSGAAREPS